MKNKEIAVGVPVDCKVKHIIIDPEAKVFGHVKPENDCTEPESMPRGERAQAIALARLKENNQQMVNAILREIDQLAKKGNRYWRKEMRNYNPAINFADIKTILESEKFRVVTEMNTYNRNWCTFKIYF